MNLQLASINPVNGIAVVASIKPKNTNNLRTGGRVVVEMSADKLNGRNINVSFTNNSNVPVEIMVFIFYSDEIAIDVKTGLVTRHKN